MIQQTLYDKLWASHAVRAEDVAKPGATLKVIGAAPAGRPFAGVVGPGETVRIFTGGETPAGADAVIVPIPVIASGSPRPAPERQIAAITYASDPDKKGLGRVLAAWQQARRDGERLVVAGLERSRLPNPGPGVELVGKLAPEQYRELLCRSKLFVCAPRREDYGIAQLEALADGCQLVTTEAAGGYEALALARELDARLVGDDLAGAIRIALDDPLPGYAARARDLLEPYSLAAVQEIVSDRLLARLLG